MCDETNERCIYTYPGSCTEQNNATMTCEDIQSQLICQEIPNDNCVWALDACHSAGTDELYCTNLQYKSHCEAVNTCRWMPDIENITFKLNIINNTIDIENELTFNLTLQNNRNENLENINITLTHTNFELTHTTKIPTEIEQQQITWQIPELNQSQNWTNTITTTPILGGIQTLQIQYQDLEGRHIENTTQITILFDEDPLLLELNTPPESYIEQHYNITLKIFNNQDLIATNINTTLNITNNEIIQTTPIATNINEILTWQNLELNPFEEIILNITLRQNQTQTNNFDAKINYENKTYQIQNQTQTIPQPYCELVHETRTLMCEDIRDEDFCRDTQDCFWIDNSCGGSNNIECTNANNEQECQSTNGICYWTENEKPICRQKTATPLTCTNVMSQTLCQFFSDITQRCYWLSGICEYGQDTINCDEIKIGYECIQTSNICEWTGPLLTDSFQTELILGEEFRLNATRNFTIQITNTENITKTNIELHLNYTKLEITNTTPQYENKTNNTATIIIPQINPEETINTTITFRANETGPTNIHLQILGGNLPIEDIYATTILEPQYPTINITLEKNEQYNVHFLTKNPTITGTIQNANYWNITTTGDIEKLLCESTTTFTGELCTPTINECEEFCELNFKINAINKDGNKNTTTIENISIDSKTPNLTIHQLETLPNPKRIYINLTAQDDYLEKTIMQLNSTNIYSWALCYSNECEINLPPNKYYWGSGNEITIRANDTNLIVDGCHTQDLENYNCEVSAIFNEQLQYLGITPKLCDNCTLETPTGFFNPYKYTNNFTAQLTQTRALTSAQLTNNLLGENVTLLITSTDVAQNKNTTNTTIILDNTLPQINITTPIQIITKNHTTINFTAQDESGIENVSAKFNEEQCTITHIENKLYNAQCNFTLTTKPKINNLTIIAIDNQSNQNQKTQEIITHNIQIPQIQGCLRVSENSTNTTNNWNYEELKLEIYQDNNCTYGEGNEELALNITIQQNFTNIENLKKLHPLEFTGQIQTTKGYNTTIQTNMTGTWNLTLYNQPYKTSPYVRNHLNQQIQHTLNENKIIITNKQIPLELKIYTTDAPQINLNETIFKNKTITLQIISQITNLDNATATIQAKEYNITCQEDICQTEIEHVINEGEYEIEINAKNRNGYITTTTDNIFFDFENPQINITTIQNNQHYKNPLTIIGEIDDIAINETQIKITNTTMNNIRTITTNQINEQYTLNDGEYKIQITTKDIFNRTSIKEYNITMDSTSPNITTNKNQTTIYQNNTNTNLEINATDTNLENLTLQIINITTNQIIYEQTNTTNSSQINYNNNLPEGEYEIQITAKDKAQNTAQDIITLIIDLTAPALTTQQTNNITYLQNAVFSASSDDAHKYRLYLNNTLITNSSFASIPNLGAGIYEYYFEAEDRAGNINTSNTYYFEIYKRTPEIFFDLEPISTYGEEIEYIELCIEQITCKIYIEDELYTNQNISAGNYNVYYKTDGNENYTQTQVLQELTIIKAQPQINFTVLNHTTNQITKPKTGNMTLDLISGELNVQVYQNEELIINDTNYNNTTNLIEGIYTYTYIHETSENYTRLSRTFTINIDNTSPNITIHEPQTGNYSQNGININLTTQDLNFYQTTIQLIKDEQIVQTRQTTNENYTEYILLPEGNYTLNATSTDYAGNTKTELITKIQLDVQGPQITTNITPHTSYKELHAQINATDDLYDSMQITIHNETITTTNNQTNLEINYFDDGIYTLTIYAQDTLGNNNTHTVPGIIIDNTAPIILNQTPQNNTIVPENNVQIELELQELSTYTINAKSNNTTITTTNPIFVMNLGEGEHNITINITDALGHKTQFNITNITLDATPPIITTISHPNNTIITNPEIILTCQAQDNLKVNRVEYELRYENKTLITTNRFAQLPELGEYYWTCTAYDDAGNQNKTEQKIIHSLNPIILNEIKNNLTINTLTKETQPIRGEIYLPNTYDDANITWIHEHERFNIITDAGIMNRTPDSMQLLTITANITMPYVEDTKQFNIQYATKPIVPVINGTINTSAPEIELTDDTTHIYLQGLSKQYLQLTNKVIRNENRKDVQINGTLKLEREIEQEKITLQLAGTITGTQEWDALFIALEPIFAPIQELDVIHAVKIGSTTPLNFSQLAIITFQNQTGKQAALITNNDELIQITETCTFPITVPHCKRNVGKDLQILTNHATTYLVYEAPTTPPSDSGTNTGGDTGGGGSSGGAIGGMGPMPPTKQQENTTNNEEEIIIEFNQTNQTDTVEITNTENTNLEIPGVHRIQKNKTYNLISNNQETKLKYENNTLIINNKKITRTNNKPITINEEKYEIIILNEQENNLLIEFKKYKRELQTFYLIMTVFILFFISFIYLKYNLYLKLYMHIWKLTFKRKIQPLIDQYYILRAKRIRAQEEREDEEEGDTI